MFGSFFQSEYFSLDFRGQLLAEKLYEYIILGGTAGGWIVGLIFQRLSFCIYAWLASVLIASVIVLPPWPWYRRNLIKWAEPVPMTVECDASAGTHLPQPTSLPLEKSGKKTGKGGNKTKKQQ